MWVDLPEPSLGFFFSETSHSSPLLTLFQFLRALTGSISISPLDGNLLGCCRNTAQPKTDIRVFIKGHPLDHFLFPFFAIRAT